MAGLAVGSRVAIVGAGLMGAQIAAEYALAGHDVVVRTRTDASARRAVDRGIASLDALVAFGVVTDGQAAAARSRLTATTDLTEACAGAAMVVESIAEDLEAKVEIVTQIGRLAPEAIVATNTSSCPIGPLGERTRTSARIVGTHYWNPPLLMPLVEVIPGAATVPAVTEIVVAELGRMGKEPVVVPDIPGFVWNRLQFALLREAVALVRRHGVAVETVDLIVRRGLGRRLSLVGPFEAMALGGAATFEAVAGLLFPELASDLPAREVARVELPSVADLAGAFERRNAALARLLLDDRAERAGR